jgi:hypothetical protein
MLDEQFGEAVEDLVARRPNLGGELGLRDQIMRKHGRGCHLDVAKPVSDAAVLQSGCVPGLMRSRIKTDLASEVVTRLSLVFAATPLILRVGEALRIRHDRR